MKYINNPILKGFNPDPSILRVGDDYYIATSTFEWFPGVQIHHSKDLINWKLITHPLNRISQLDMRGNPSSGGVWAPCLSYDNGTFYLIYTDVKSLHGIFKDTHNYLVTTKDILGQWSEPIYLNSSGFDPSLFHDDDGRKWFVNMIWEHREEKNSFAGIVLQEYSSDEKQLVGTKMNIFLGSEIKRTEGPHLYKHNGYYYLMTAEGGTSWEHAVTVARSRSITGPYEICPDNPLITSVNNPTLELQKAGHGSLVETQNKEWYVVHLCGRPLPSRGRCTLGRETAIQKVEWTKEGWLRLSQGGNEPFLQVPAPKLPEHPWKTEPEREDFDSETLNINFQTLRVPLGEDSLSLKERSGFLRLKGQESLSSLFKQSLVARRQQSFCYTATTVLEYNPESSKQMAGLISLYDTENFYYLRISNDEKLGKCLGIIACDNGIYRQYIKDEVSIDGWDKCYLRVQVDYDKLQFFYSMDGENWITIGEVLDSSIMSDEYKDKLRFTGSFVGMCCQDLDGTKRYADFDFFEYVEKRL